MKKIYLLLLVLCAGVSAFAQKTIQSKIKDMATGEPVEMATITAEGTTISTVSNAEGSFRITLPASVTQLNISHLNYRPYTINVADASDEINLEPSIFTLEEVVVTNQPVEGLLRGAVKASKKKMEKSLLLNTYYREFVKINGRYVRFADGLVDFYVKRKSGAADVYVNQSRTRKLVKVGDTKIMTRGGDSITQADMQTIESIGVYKIDDAIETSYNFGLVNKIASDADLYDLTLKTRQDKNGRNLQIVSIKPKAGGKGLYMGTVTYDTATNLILDANIQIDPAFISNAPEVKIFGIYLRITAIEKHTSFVLDKDKYIVSYNKGRVGIYIKFRDKIDDNMEFLNDMVVNNHKETEETPDRATRFRGKNLYNAGNHYTTEFWKNSNALLLTAAEEAILKSME